MKSDGVSGLVLCIAMVVLLLCGGECQAAYLQTPGPAPQPVNSSSPTPQPTFPTYGVTPGSLHPQECPGRCAYRCSATAYKKACLFFCGKCCAACLCVPPGTYGNKEACPCYNNWKTKRGGPKCP